MKANFVYKLFNPIRPFCQRVLENREWAVREDGPRKITGYSCGLLPEPSLTSGRIPIFKIGSSGLFFGAGLVCLAVFLIAAVFWPLLVPGEGSASTAEKTPITAEVKTVNVGGFPYYLAVTPDSNYACVNDYWNGIVYRIVLASATVEQTINLGACSNTGIAITPDGNSVYTADCFSDRLSKIDTATHTVSTTITGMGRPYDVVIDPSGTYAYASDYQGNNIRVVTLASDTLSTTISGLNLPYVLALTPNGSYLYAAN